MNITTLVTCCATTVEAMKTPREVGGTERGVKSSSARKLSAECSAVQGKYMKVYAGQLHRIKLEPRSTVVLVY